MRGQHHHGHSAQKKSPTYQSWSKMLERCNNPNSVKFPRYGGRGIRVHERWLLFENFLADMSERPVGHTLGRKDNNKDYCMDNCEWQTPKTQANNRSDSRLITFGSEIKTIKQWAEHFGIPYQTLFRRIKSGWPLEKAFEQAKESA